MLHRQTKVTNAQLASTPVLGAQVPPAAKTTTPPQPHVTPQPQPVVSQQIQPGDPFADVKAKLAKLKQLSADIKDANDLYKEQDALTEEVLPLFVSIVGNDIVIHRKITLGNDTYELTPIFVDDKGNIQMKAWKSVAQRMFTIK